MERKSKIQIVVLVCICFLILLVFCGSYFISPQHAYAQIGSEIKDKLKSSVYYEPMTDEEKEEYQNKLDAMDFKFAIPSEFKDGVNQTQLNLSKVYFAPINQYEKNSEWLKYSVQKRVELSQIPTDLINEMSTDELIITCLNYNLLGDVGLYGSYQEGFAILKKQYNGLSELLKRTDIGPRLLELYKAINLNEFSEKDRFCTIRMNVILMLLAEESVLQTLNPSETKDLINECYTKGKLILETKSSFFCFTMETYVGLRCLYIKDSSVQKIINSNKALKAYVTEEAPFISIDEIDDETIGKIAVLIDENYL